MATLTDRLTVIAEQLAAGDPSPSVTVRSFLAWFGAQRRGYWKVRIIRQSLKSAGLLTEPDFEGAYIDSEISFRRVPATVALDLTSTAVAEEAALDSTTADDGSVVAAQQDFVGGAESDPTYRVGKLQAANTTPVSVSQDSSLREAVTQMLLSDFSQLPVMQGERIVKGVISWQSIGSRLALGCSGEKVADYLDPASEVSADMSLFSAIPTIIAKQYVLVRGVDQKISGIITTSDLSLQFRQLAEPFLLIGEIENHIRRLIDGKFTPLQLRDACDPADTERVIESVADLAFGEYQRLLENPDRWGTVGLGVDRATFVKQLDRVREIRNDVMHFDPDPVGEDELAVLRNFVGFFQTLQQIGAS